MNASEKKWYHKVTDEREREVRAREWEGTLGSYGEAAVSVE